ncbi:MAG: RHS repeat protein [Candidatus Aminicenantes bacterium]|nr:MAG: RHS repeat protein [Candidatus Aminicenantes bacterium]
MIVEKFKHKIFWAFLVLLLFGFIPLFKGNISVFSSSILGQQRKSITGVVIATRTDQEKKRSLLITASSGISGKLVDEIHIELAKDAAAQAVPGHLPSDWTFTGVDREIALTGPALESQQNIYIRVDVGSAKAPTRLKVKMFSSGSKVFDKRVQVSLLPPLRLINSLEDLIILPPEVSPGENLMIEVLDPQITPSGGNWTISSVLAEEEFPVSGKPGDNPRLSVKLPGSLIPGNPVEIAYTDPWGQQIVHVPFAEGVQVVPPLTPSSAYPSLTSCQLQTFPGEVICVCGFFPNEAAWSALSFDGQPLGYPASASSRVVHVQIPMELGPGPHVIAGSQEAGFSKDNTLEITVLTLGGEIDQDALRRGQSTTMRLWIEGTQEPVSLEITNQTPGIISIAGGDVQIVSTSGGNPNSLERTVQGISPGDFQIDYALDMDEPCPCVGGEIVLPSGAVPSVILNDDSYVYPYNNLSSYGDKFVQIDGGVFYDASNDCPDCPADAVSLISIEGNASDTPDPIILHNGEFVIQETDLLIPGRGFDWTFTRTYRSRMTHDGPLGHNWDFNYNSRLIEITEENQDRFPSETFAPVKGDQFSKIGSVVLMDGHSRSDIYGLQSDGSYSSPLGSFTRLEKNDDGTFTLRDRHESRKDYDKNGFLILLESGLCGCRDKLIFKRDTQGKLVEAIDSLGRKIEYIYNDEGRLVEVKDFINRSVKFAYDSHGDLVSVISPTVTGTPNGNDFLEGKTTKYTYSSGFADEKLNHDLMTVTAPNEVANNGPPRLVNVYDTNKSSYAYGRVIKQTYGGTNASGIKAGGIVIYLYEELEANPSGVNEPVNLVTVTDRNGNKTEYKHNKLGNPVSIKEFSRGLREGDPEFFETVFEYNQDGQRIKAILPEGNMVLNSYSEDSGNILETTQIPDSDRGGTQAQITATFSYEPIFNRVKAKTDPRGNDSGFRPPNGGENSPARYTTTYFYDYQEGNNIQALAGFVGIPAAELQGMLDRAGMKVGLGDLNGDGIVDQVQGNVVKIAYPMVTLPSDSNLARLKGNVKQEIVELFVYNRYGQLTKFIDPEKNVTTLDYFPENDPDGNGEDKIEGNSDEAFGYLKEIIVDSASHPQRDSGENPEPAKIRTQYFYDPVGNIIKEVDGRGIATEYVINQLNQKVQIIQAASVSDSQENGLKAFKYQTNLTYDSNDNIVKVEEENRDTNNIELAGNFVEHTFSYDILDNLIKESLEATESEVLVTEYRYDANENRTEIKEPEGNFHTVAYDERDLELMETEGAGGKFGGEPSTITYNYDRNSFLVEEIDGEDNNGDGKNDSITHIYDGFNRLIKSLDPAGNTVELTYDPADNIVGIARSGVIGGQSPKDNSGSRNVLLSQTEYFLDEINRPYQDDELLFVSSGVATQRAPVLLDGPPDQSSDGRVSTRYEYDRNSRVAFIVEDDGDVYAYHYDGTGRMIAEIDPEGNRVDYTYDDNDNETKVVETEVTQQENSPTLQEKFATLNVYDALDRLVRTTDNLGHTIRYGYDSRDNLIFTNDAQGDEIDDDLGLFKGKINRSGNTVHYFYDGVDREIKEVQDLRKGGNGSGEIDTSNPSNPDGKISTAYEYDRNSRIIAVIDDNNNKTSYGYDNMNRLITENFADGTANQLEYDRDSNLVKFTDQNGTVRVCRYDAVNRLTQREITRTDGVVGSTLQKFEYDGLFRPTLAFDNNEPTNSADDSTVAFVYDSLGRLMEEVQNGHAVTSQWDGDGNRVALIYPDGRKIEMTHDKLDRINKIRSLEAGEDIVDYDYIGPGRVLEKTYSNGMRLNYLNDDRTGQIGYDGIKRKVKQRHLTANNDLIAGFGYGFDRMNNRLYEERLHEFGGKKNTGDVFAYDSAGRLITQKKEIPSPSVNPDGGNPGSRLISYTLDGVGNWMRLSTEEELFDNAVNEMNEYTQFGGKMQNYDKNGNLVQDERFMYEYDFANRLRAVKRRADNTEIARYSYDSFAANFRASGSGRRIGKTVANSGDLDGTVEYLYDRIHCIEERTPNGSVQQYVYGRGIDDPLAMSREKDTFFYHSDGRDNIVALTDPSGNVVERYTYDAYGKPKVFDSSGTEIPLSRIANPFLYTGRRLDPETGLFYYRARNYDPEKGRFIQRDVLGYKDGMNLYAYALSNPINFIDPLGEDGDESGLEAGAEKIGGKGARAAAGVAAREYFHRKGKYGVAYFIGGRCMPVISIALDVPTIFVAGKHLIMLGYERATDDTEEMLERSRKLKEESDRLKREREKREEEEARRLEEERRRKAEDWSAFWYEEGHARYCKEKARQEAEAKAKKKKKKKVKRGKRPSRRRASRHARTRRTMDKRGDRQERKKYNKERNKIGARMSVTRVR